MFPIKKLKLIKKYFQFLINYLHIYDKNSIKRIR